MRLLLHRTVRGMLLVVVMASTMQAQLTYETALPDVKPKKRELYFYGLRSYPFGKIPQNARSNAIDKATTKMLQFNASDRGMLSSNQWKQIGPLQVGGRVRSVVVHPTDGNTLWIAAADGGVWKSTNKGGDWTPVMDNENSIAMGALALDPSNSNILYAATGEMSSNIDAYTGAGIYKSIDGGSSWKGTGLTNVGAFSKVVVHPANSNLIFAGATKNGSGLYRSEDGGRTWTRTFTEQVSDVTVSSTNQAEVWVGTMAKGVYRSTDGGRNFTASNDGIGLATLGRASVQAAPSNANILYALFDESVGSGESATHYSRIYKSTDGGVQWQIVFNNAPNFLASTGNAQGFYNNAIGISPSDPNVVFGLGIDIVRTTNGGTSWTSISAYGGALHPDQHAVAFDPTTPNRIYIGNDGGVYRSENLGLSYNHVSKGLAITQFYAMGIDQLQPDVTYGGTQDNGTVSTAGDAILGGDGFYVMVDYTNSDLIYAETPNGEYYRIENGVRRRIMAGIDPNDGAAWSSPFVMDPVDPSILYSGRHYVYVSLDRGDYWIQTDARFSGEVSAIGISRANHAVAYAGSATGELKVTTNGGENWTDRSAAPGMPNRAITDLVPSNTDANTAYMAVSGFYTNHVFKTTDQGATWTDIGNGLPDIPVNALALHSDDERIIYAGSDVGMFITVDGGATWANYSQGLPRAAVIDLEVHRSSKTLRMASHGRSMWEIPLESPTIVPSVTAPSGGEVWMGGSTQVISWSGFSGPIRLEISFNDGASWYKVGENLVGPSYRWLVADTTSDYAVIRAVSMDDNEQALSRTFTITRYNRGGVLAAGQTISVPYGIAYDGEYLWTTDFGSDKLLKLDPKTMKTVGMVKMNLVNAPAYFTDLVYVPQRGTFFINRLLDTGVTDPNGSLYEVDKDGNQLGIWPAYGTYPIGLALLGNTLIATDRNNDAEIYHIDLNSFDRSSSTRPTPSKVLKRKRKIFYGPRGATQSPDPNSFYQVITDFTGSTLQNTIAEKMNAETQELACKLELTSPVTGGYINARGIELDPSDSNLWVTDYSGNVFKIISCDGTANVKPLEPVPPASAPGTVVPEGMSLSQNLPNPFTGTTEIQFSLPVSSKIRLVVYDATGREVATVTEQSYQAGTHRVTFDPDGLPSGVYRYSLMTDRGSTITRTMVFLR